MRTIASLSVVVFLFLAGVRAGEDNLIKRELTALRGNWNVFIKVPGRTDQEVLQQYSFVENRVQIRIGGNNSPDFKFTVNPAKKPKEIDKVHTRGDGSEITALGIYELQGDKLKVRFGEFGKERPTEFEAKTLVYNREKKQDK